jgi:hypothetical protein
MQMGSRWLVGNSPHRSVPSILHTSIAELEGSTLDAKSWTITWLEGMPQLALDGQLRLTINTAGTIIHVTPNPERTPAATGVRSHDDPADDTYGDTHHNARDNTEDDDDWLR